MSLLVDSKHLEALIIQAMPIDYKCRFNEMKLKVRREKLLEDLLKYCSNLAQNQIQWQKQEFQDVTIS